MLSNAVLGFRDGIRYMGCSGNFCLKFCKCYKLEKFLIFIVIDIYVMQLNKIKPYLYRTKSSEYLHMFLKNNVSFASIQIMFDIRPFKSINHIKLFFTKIISRYHQQKFNQNFNYNLQMHRQAALRPIPSAPARARVYGTRAALGAPLAFHKTFIYSVRRTHQTFLYFYNLQNRLHNLYLVYNY